MTPCIFYLRLHLYGKNNVNLDQTLDRYGDFCLEPIKSRCDTLKTSMPVPSVASQIAEGVVYACLFRLTCA